MGRGEKDGSDGLLYDMGRWVGGWMGESVPYLLANGLAGQGGADRGTVPGKLCNGVHDCYPPPPTHLPLLPSSFFEEGGSEGLGLVWVGVVYVEGETVLR